VHTIVTLVLLVVSNEAAFSFVVDELLWEY